MLKLEREELWLIVVYAIAVGLLSLAAPVGVQAMVGTIAFGAVVQPVVVLALIVLLTLSAAAALDAVRFAALERLEQRVFARVAADMGQRLPLVSAEALDIAHGPELANRFFSVFSFQKALATLAADGLGTALQMSVGLIVLALYHPILLAFAGVIFVALYLIVRPLGRDGASTSIVKSYAKYAMAHWAQELVRHPVTFRSKGGREYGARVALQKARKHLDARRRHFRVVFRQHMVSVGVRAIVLSSLLAVGGWLVITRKLTLGQLVAAELIMSAAVGGFEKLGKYMATYYDLIADGDKLGHVVDLPLEEQGSAPVSKLPRGMVVELRDASYRPSDGTSLEPISLRIEPGCHVALSGAEGSGKSTLVDFLFGLRTPTAGTLDFNGTDSRSASRQSLRAQVALVRGIEIFSGTVLDNIALGRPEVTEEVARAALVRVGGWSAVARLPGGMHEVLATGGAPLSRSQALRLCLARAVAMDPRLLLIDEALEGLEASAQTSVMAALTAPDVPWSLVVVTNQPSLHAYCTHIVTLPSTRGGSEPPTPPPPRAPRGPGGRE
jgi:ABC-type bacteriocin/lantibiotic exporter with double-glycine peptidase domain